jgi:hypothetical protein
MIAAVSRESEVADHLEGYLNRNKRGPNFVSGRPAQARKPNAPGDEVPNENGKVAASSARPGKRSNDTVPYARIGFNDFERSAANPADALPGDVLLINRTTGGRGHDSNRVTKSATIRQINAVLDAQQREGYGAIVNPASPGMLAKIKDARTKQKDLMVMQVDHMRNDVDKMRALRSSASLSIADMQKRLGEAEAMKAVLVGSVVTCNPCGIFSPFFDWRAVDVLREWSPDGVLLNKDDDERNADWFAAGGGDSGTVFNVAVQGPARLRNCTAPEFESAGGSDQLIDRSLCALDDVLLLLVCMPRMGGTPAKVKQFSFKYKLCSGRVVQLLSKSALDKAKAAMKAGRDEAFSDAAAHGTDVSERDVAQTVAVWKIGKVMDTNLVTGKHASARVNVAIREVGMLEARDDCGLRKGLGAAHDQRFFADLENQYVIDAA